MITATGVTFHVKEMKRLNSFPGKVVLGGTRAKQKKARAYGTRTDTTYNMHCIEYGTCLKLRADAQIIFVPREHHDGTRTNASFVNNRLN